METAMEIYRLYTAQAAPRSTIVVEIKN